MLTDVLIQPDLSIGGSRDEHCTSISNRLSDCLEEVVIFRAAPAPDGVCLMVDVAGGMIRVQHELFDISRAEMEHPCFMVIDPNDGMKVMAVHRGAPPIRFSKLPQFYTVAAPDRTSAAHG